MSSLSAKQAADLIGVSIKTLHRWEAAGKIHPTRTAGGHRRYQVADLLGHQGDSALTLGYARVSHLNQKAALERQVIVLESYCTQQGWNFEIIKDLGSGIDTRKRGLKQLLKLIAAGEVERLVLTHKDRLLRFGSDLVFSLCEQFGTEIVIINRSEDAPLEEDLAHDLLEIITLFSARLYGSRSHNNKQIVEQLREVAESLK